MDNFAPVLIPTLNRYEHFKRCVQSLAACTHADKTDLFIALDYPLNGSHWEGYKKIKAFLPEIKGFKSVQVIERDMNYGASGNIQDARKKIFEHYDRMIFSEDDNEFSPNFLDYINKGLDKFENNQRILAICGYNYPIKIPDTYQQNYYFHKEFSAWGYGIWRHKFLKPEVTPEKMKRLLMKKEVVRELKRLSGRHYYNILTAIRLNTTKTGDFAVFLNNLINDQYCLFPVVSKVRNHGHDGSGIHCGNLNKTRKRNIYASQQLDFHRHFDFSIQPDLEDENIIFQLKEYFHMSNKAKVKQILYYIVYLVLGRKKKEVTSNT